MSEQLGHTVYYGQVVGNSEFVALEVEPPLDKAHTELATNYLKSAVPDGFTQKLAAAVAVVRSERRTRFTIQRGPGGSHTTAKGFASALAAVIDPFHTDGTVLAEISLDDDFAERNE